MVLYLKNIDQNYLNEILEKNPSLQELKLTSCNITYVPFIKGLRDLTCLHCEPLKIISVDPKSMKKLQIEECTNLLKIQNINSCKLDKLVIHYSKINSIIISNNVEMLACNHNENLKYINVEGVKCVMCNNCPELVRIDNVSKLENLMCMNCPMLKKISLMPCLKGLEGVNSIMGKFGNENSEQNAINYHEWVLTMHNLAAGLKHHNLSERILKNVIEHYN